MSNSHWYVGLKNLLRGNDLSFSGMRQVPVKEIDICVCGLCQKEDYDQQLVGCEGGGHQLQYAR